MLGGLFGGWFTCGCSSGVPRVLRRGGQDPFYWWLKSPGETMAALVLLVSSCGVIALAVIYFRLGGIVDAVLRGMPSARERRVGAIGRRS
ncbi:MAG: hypothetical protein U0232_05110 [Thermomicrobiales bacterium]